MSDYLREQASLTLWSFEECRISLFFLLCSLPQQGRPIQTFFDSTNSQEILQIMLSFEKKNFALGPFQGRGEVFLGVLTPFYSPSQTYTALVNMSQNMCKKLHFWCIKLHHLKSYIAKFPSNFSPSEHHLKNFLNFGNFTVLNTGSLHTGPGNISDQSERYFGQYKSDGSCFIKAWMFHT